jgi:hypothetical protein
VPGRKPFSAAILLTALLVVLLAADPVFAYLGPGAGLEFVGYFMALLATVGVAFLSILLYPIYAVVRYFRGAPKATEAPAAEAAAVPASQETPVAPN